MPHPPAVCCLISVCSGSHSGIPQTGRLQQKCFPLVLLAPKAGSPRSKCQQGGDLEEGVPSRLVNSHFLTEVRTEKASSPVSLLEDLHPIKGWGGMPILTSSRPQHLPKGPSPNSITLWLELPLGNWGRDIAQPTTRQLQPPPTEDTKAPRC